MKFMYDTAAVGCINNSDECAYRQEVEQLESWRRENNLGINVKGTKADFWRGNHSTSPLHIRGAAVVMSPAIGVWVCTSPETSPGARHLLRGQEAPPAPALL